LGLIHHRERVSEKFTLLENPIQCGKPFRISMNLFFSQRPKGQLEPKFQTIEQILGTTQVNGKKFGSNLA